jgi:hypothetical protein
MYKVIKNIISKDECQTISQEFELLTKEKDKQVKNSDILYKWDLSDKYSQKFKPIVEDFYSMKLKSDIAYTRKSFKNQILRKHKDAVQLVLSIFIKQQGEGKNPLYIYPDNIKTEILLEEGDGVIFEGHSIYHERPPIVSDWIIGMYIGYGKSNNGKLI